MERGYSFYVEDVEKKGNLCCIKECFNCDMPVNDGF